VRLVASVVHSYFEHPPGSADNVTSISIAEAWRDAGLGPRDLSLVELHDSSAVTELLTYDHLGLARPEDCVALLVEGQTRLGGRIPVNVSGGLLRKGHPVGATGVIITVKAMYELQRSGGRYGLITMCIGGGQGIAMVIEHLNEV